MIVLTSSQLDPKRALHLAHWPIRMMRLITDPITDSVIYVLNKLFFPVLLKVLRSMLYIVVRYAIQVSNRIAGPEPVEKVMEYVGEVVSPFSSFELHSMTL